MSAIYYWTIREVVFIKKNFYLASTFDVVKGQPAIDDLNNMLECVGVSFSIREIKTGHKKIFIEVDEDKLRTATNTKAGRPIEHKFDIAEIEQMKASGMNNKQIYESLGMSKSLFYLKMREYKNNIGQ
ncbi:MAG: hypothetical protein IIW54_15115 [Lachnospiraceae bacterium]|nr:hypothetical protein [Lachnospiraceae bacterium]